MVDLRNAEGVRKPRDAVSKAKQKYIASLTKGIEKGDKAVIKIKAKGISYEKCITNVNLWLNYFFSKLTGSFKTRELDIAKKILNIYDKEKFTFDEITSLIQIEVKKQS